MAKASSQGPRPLVTSTVYKNVLSAIKPCVDNGLLPFCETRGTLLNTVICPLEEQTVHFCARILDCRKCILINTSYWDFDSVAHDKLVACLRLLNQRIHEEGQYARVNVYCLFDNGSVSSLWRPKYLSLRQMTRLRLPVDLRHVHVTCRVYHRPLMGTLHSKFFVFDDQEAWLVSHNIQDRPNLEMSVHLQGTVAQDMAAVFWQTWFQSKPASRQFQSVLDGKGENCSNGKAMAFANRGPRGNPFIRSLNSPQCQAWLTAVETCTSSVFVCSPTFNAKPLIKALIAAVERGIHVTCLLTSGFNDKKESMPFQGGNNLRVVRKMYKKCQELPGRLDILWYVPRALQWPKKGAHCHVKYMSVDGQVAIFGNGNADTQSWFHSQEVNLVIPDSHFVQYCDGLLLQHGRQWLFSYPHVQGHERADPGMPHYAY